MEYSFDRGTIIIDSGWPPARRTGPLPGFFLWDARVTRWRAPAHRLPAFRAWLREREIEVVYRSPRPPGFLPERVPGESLPRLRPYQEDALRAWHAAGRRGLVSLPTGSGKTRVAVRAMLALERPAIVIVPTRQLLRQWVAVVSESYPGPVGAYGDGERDVRPITVATYESARRQLDRFGDHFDLLVIDEAHHLASAEVEESARMATARYRLGLSATPRAAGSRFTLLLGELIGPICFELPISRLAGSYLAPFERNVVTLKLAPEEQAEYDRLRLAFTNYYWPFVEANPKATWEEFARAASKSPAGREALAALRRSREVLSLPRSKISAIDQILDSHPSEPTLIFTAGNRAAYEISRRFLIPAITCDIDRRERERILERFRSGTYRAIVSAKVLNEGLDVPAASVAIISGGSQSPVEHAQRIGRVLRPVEGKGAVVYELGLAGTRDWRAGEKRSRIDVLDPAPSP